MITSENPELREVDLEPSLREVAATSRKYKIISESKQYIKTISGTILYLKDRFSIGEETKNTIYTL